MLESTITYYGNFYWHAFFIGFAVFLYATFAFRKKLAPLFYWNAIVVILAVFMAPEFTNGDPTGGEGAVLMLIILPSLVLGYAIAGAWTLRRLAKDSASPFYTGTPLQKGLPIAAIIGMLGIAFSYFSKAQSYERVSACVMIHGNQAYLYPERTPIATEYPSELRTFVSEGAPGECLYLTDGHGVYAKSNVFDGNTYKIVASFIP